MDIPITVLALACVALSAYGFYRYRVKTFFYCALACVLGLLSYFAVGVGVSRLSGRGRFYSFPFGGLRVNDYGVIWSLMVWILLWLGLIFIWLRSRRASGRGPLGSGSA